MAFLQDIRKRRVQEEDNGTVVVKKASNGMVPTLFSSCSSYVLKSHQVPYSALEFLLPEIRTSLLETLLMWRTLR